MTARIEQWSVKSEYSAYRAPELCPLCLVGIVYGHPRKRDGTEVVTTPITHAKGRIITTSRTVYELGEPSVEYLAWLERQGIELDPEAPIKVGGTGR